MRYAAYKMLTDFLWVPAAPWLALRALRGEAEWRERAGRLPRVGDGCVWAHCASVGEVVAAAPILRELAAARRGVHLSVVTRTGRSVADRLAPGSTISFAPLDLAPFVRRALSTIMPSALLLVETELWPNLLAESFTLGVPVAIVNARLSERSLKRYLSGWTPLPELCGRISAVACQTGEDAERFGALGVPASSISVAGNTKYDSLPEPATPCDRAVLRESLGISADRPVVVFGSVRPDEEEIVAAAAATVLGALPEARLILAPRHMARLGHIGESLDRNGVQWTRRSRVERDGSRPSAILLDTTGELQTVYSIADVAFVGGTLAPYGGHNPLEPASQGVPVLIGPHTDSCRDSAGALLEFGGAREVNDAASLAEAVIALLSDGDLRSRVAGSALSAVDAGRGASRRALEFLKEKGVLDEPVGAR